MTGDNQHRNSYLQFITAMLIFGTIGIFRKYILLSSGMLAFTRGLLGCVFLLFFIDLIDAKPFISPRKCL